MELKHLHHVSINVHDIKETGDFYLNVLGLEKVFRPDLGFPGLWLQTGDQQIHLIQVENHQAPEGQHFAFWVEDIDTIANELKAKGVSIKGPKLQSGGLARQAFFKDPSGNLIELNQPL